MAALSFARSDPTPLLQSARTVNRSRPEDQRRSFEKRLTGIKVDASADFFMRGTTLSPLGKREQTKARNRAVILAAARKIFGELGYDATTVRDVIRATDLSVGTFYEYFRDKEEVFAAVAEDAWGALRARL